jgi:hypothetical protein
MERLNKITLRSVRKKHKKPAPIFLSSYVNGKFQLSKGLYELLGKPEFVEFVLANESLYIMASSPDVGFKVIIPTDFNNLTFSSKKIKERFFKSGKQRVVVFTDPIPALDDKFNVMYLLKL